MEWTQIQTWTWARTRTWTQTFQIYKTKKDANSVMFFLLARQAPHFVYERRIQPQAESIRCSVQSSINTINCISTGVHPALTAKAWRCRHANYQNLRLYFRYDSSSPKFEYWRSMRNTEGQAMRGNLLPSFRLLVKKLDSSEQKWKNLQYKIKSCH